MAEDRLGQAIELVQSGNIEAAREQLELIIKEDRQNVAAWHWYAQTWPKDSEKIRVWEACLRYNPESQLAQDALKDLKFVQSRKTNPEIQVPVRRVRPQTNRSAWLVWLSIAMLAALAIFAWVAVRNSAPKDPQGYKHVQPVEYYLYVPQDYSVEREWPLFVGIHGAGGDGLDCWNLWQSYADKEGFVLLCPSIPGSPDGFYQDVGESTVWSAVGEVKKEYRLRQRMFLAGFSAGAFFIQGFADHYPSYVSGLSILSSGLYLNPNAFPELVPMLVGMGDQDNARAVEISQQFVGQLRQYGFDVQYELMPGVGHGVTRDGADLTIELFRKTIIKK
jgi:hypothetical protein